MFPHKRYFCIQYEFFSSSHNIFPQAPRGTQKMPQSAFSFWKLLLCQYSHTAPHRHFRQDSNTVWKTSWCIQKCDGGELMIPNYCVFSNIIWPLSLLPNFGSDLIWRADSVSYVFICSWFSFIRVTRLQTSVCFTNSSLILKMFKMIHISIISNKHLKNANNHFQHS